MFETQFGLRENPFRAGHNSPYVYPSQEHQEALALLSAAIENREPFVLITGDSGTGKSTAVYEALGEWGSRAVVAVISNPKLTRSELLEELGLRFGAGSPDPTAGPKPAPPLDALLGAIRARGEAAILLLDDAHLLEAEFLEEIGRLSELEMEGEPLLQVFLVGRPMLEVKLAHAELRDLSQRVAIHHRMSPLSTSETARYIHHRVTAAGGNARELFPTDTCIEVFRISNGNPAEINMVAGQALLNAVGEGSPTVTAEHVGAVEREIAFQGTLRDRAQAVTPPAAAPNADTYAASPTDVGGPNVEWYAELGNADPNGEGPNAETRNAEPYAETPTAGPYAETPFAEPYAETPTAGPYAARESDMEPMPTLEEMLSSMNPPAPAVSPKPEPIPTPVAKTVPQLSVPATDDDTPLQILPSWFDEVVAKRQQIDEATATAPAPATMRSQTAARPDDASPTPTVAPSATDPTFVPFDLTSTTSADDAMFAPAAKTPSSAANAPTAPRLDSEWSPSANAPAFVPLAPAMTPESESFSAAASRVPIVPPTDEVASESDRSETPVDLLAARLRAEFAEVEHQASAKRTGFGWLVGATVVATVAIAAVLLIRFGLLTLKPEDSVPAAATAPEATPVAPPSAPPARRSTVPAPVPVVGGSGVAEPTPSTSGTASEAAAVDPAKPAIALDLFGIAVGTFLEEKRAIAQRTSVTESTQLPTQVITVIEGTTSMYRVVVGSFEDRVGAERAAADLVRRGLVDEVRVIQLARATPPPP